MTRLNLIKIAILAQLVLLSLATHIDVDDQMFDLMTGGSVPENPHSSLFNNDHRPRKKRLRAPVDVRKNHLDMLCHENNTVDNLCTIKNQRLHFTQDLTFVTTYSIIFEDSKLVCLTKALKACDFGFQLDAENARLELHGNSAISGRQVLIEVKKGRVLFSDRAHLNVTGFSQNTNGTMSHGAGAAFIGMAGTCGKGVKHRTYGEFNMVPHKKHMLLFNS